MGETSMSSDRQREAARIENFTPFGSRLRYDEEAEPENLDRVLWNQLCADLLEHVASLIR